MSPPLRVLLVEDVEADAELVVRELRRGGYDVTYERAETAEATAGALARGPWDAIICDCALPRFGVMAALDVVKRAGLDVPFIAVSGVVREEMAVETIRAGAHDFVSKERLARLVPSVEREIRAAATRADSAKIQAQLRISERMASVGTLAAGVAHEINNPMAAAISNIEVALERIAALRAEAPSGAALDEGLRATQEALEDARAASERVRLIVRDLKVFSRIDEPEATVIDVREVLEPSIRMAQNEIRHRARLVKELAAVPRVRANGARLGQIFLNLLVNAAQAIEEGRADENEIRVTTSVDAGGRVVVEVSDTGRGIPEASLARVFEAFYSTKPAGAGTGLGLSICHRIVASLGGEITVQSKVGEGTTFRVALPPCLDEVVPPPPSAPAPRSGVRARVLLIDDEPMVGAALRRMLATEHDVLAMTSARDALALLERGERFDVILTDLMMPEMTGMELHGAVTRLSPPQATRIVVMTGGAFTESAHAFLKELGTPPIEKPVPREKLRALVREMASRPR